MQQTIPFFSLLFFFFQKNVVYNLSHIYRHRIIYMDMHIHKGALILQSEESGVISDHELTEICWISLLELGMGKALVMHAYPAWFLWSRNGKGTNISSYDPHKQRIKRRKKEMKIHQ